MFQWLGRALECFPWFRAYREDRLLRQIDSGFVDDSPEAFSEPTKTALPEQYRELKPFDAEQWPARRSLPSVNERGDA